MAREDFIPGYYTVQDFLEMNPLADVGDAGTEKPYTKEYKNEIPKKPSWDDITYGSSIQDLPQNIVGEFKNLILIIVGIFALLLFIK